MRSLLRSRLPGWLLVGLAGLAQAQLSSPVPGKAPVGATAALNHGGTPAPQLKELPGVTSWKLLAQVKTTQKDKRFVTEFAPPIRALNKKPIKLQGFMMPLGPADAQAHFLLTLTPQSCLFCLPAGPEGMVEVKMLRPIKITFDPIVVTGTFESLQDDKNGLLYRLSGATLSK
jgi:uncharacterized protein